MARKPNIHYVNNKDFSAAVMDYVKNVKSAKKKKEKVPIVPDYIAESFLKISEGLSHKSNFVRYTYREEMVMDGVENCLRAIENYNIDTATRTGNANAFAYFTQITWYAFLRRIAKEKKQQDIKLKWLSQIDIQEFIEEGDNDTTKQIQSYVDSLRERIDRVKDTDQAVKDFAEQQKKPRKKRTVYADSDLSEFL
jgi:methyl-accepting chemotaxis protein